MTEPPNPSLIDVAIAALAAARSAEDPEVQTFYLACARRAVDKLGETLRTMTINVESLERELVQRGPPKRIVESVEASK